MNEGRNYSLNGSKYNNLQYQISNEKWKIQVRKYLSFNGDAKWGQGESPGLFSVFSSASDRKLALFCSLGFSFVFVGEPS